MNQEFKKQIFNWRNHQSFPNLVKITNYFYLEVTIIYSDLHGSSEFSDDFTNESSMSSGIGGTSASDDLLNDSDFEGLLSDPKCDQSKILGDDTYWINSNSEHFNLINQNDLDLEIRLFDFGFTSSTPTTEPKQGDDAAAAEKLMQNQKIYFPTPTSILEQVKEDEDGHLQFLNSFSRYSERLFEVFGDLYPYQLPDRARIKIASTFYTKYEQLQEHWEKYRFAMKFDSDMKTESGRNKHHAQNFTIEVSISYFFLFNYISLYLF